jgi:hypothetical protein
VGGKDGQEEESGLSQFILRLEDPEGRGRKGGEEDDGEEAVGDQGRGDKGHTEEEGSGQAQPGEEDGRRWIGLAQVRAEEEGCGEEERCPEGRREETRDQERGREEGRARKGRGAEERAEEGRIRFRGPKVREKDQTCTLEGGGEEEACVIDAPCRMMLAVIWPGGVNNRAPMYNASSSYSR